MHPMLYHVGDWTVRSYGLLLAFAFLTGAVSALDRAPRYGIEPRRVIHAFSLVLVSVLVGARLHYIADHAVFYASDHWRALRLSEGGLNMYGGALLAALVVLFYARCTSISFVKLGALFAAPLALGEAITRVGCFLNGCCFGVQCYRPWGVVFPPASAAGSVWPGIAVHPTQLYTAAASFGVFVLLLAAERAHARPGAVLGLFLALHGVIRFVVEGYRYHAPSVMTFSIAGSFFTSGELVSLGLIAVGLPMLWRRFTDADAPAPTKSLSRLSWRGLT